MHNLKILWLLGLGFVAIGCGKTGPSGSRSISGKLTTTYVSVGGTVLASALPRDLSHAQIAALQFDGANYHQYAGTGASDGTFKIANVPPGTVLFQIGTFFVETDASQINADSRIVTRPDAKPNAIGADIQVSATGMSAWQDTDALLLDCPAVGDSWGLGAIINTDGTVNPAAGATTLSNFVFAANEASFQPPNFIEADKGDRCMLLHQVSHTVDAKTSYTNLPEAAMLAPFNTASGTAVSTNGAFAPLAAPTAVSVDVRGSQFAPLFSALTPSGSNWAGDITIGLQADDPHHAYDANLLNVLDLSFGASDPGPVAMSFGSPFAGWQPSVTVSYTFDVQPKLDGSTRAAALAASYFAIYPDLGVLGAPIKPELSPVAAITINGLDLQMPQKGVGVTPAVSWQPPAMGTASYYGVQLWHLTLDAQGATVATYAATLLTKQTRLHLPPSLLTVGDHYIVLIQAWHEAVSDLSAEIGSLPASFIEADHPSAIFVP